MCKIINLRDITETYKNFKMHRARLILQASNKIGNSERFASWLVKKPQAAVVPALNRLKSSTAAEPFLNGSSSAYVETMYNAWLNDPNSVHAPGVAYTSPPNLAPYSKNEVPLTSLVPVSGSPINEKIIDDHLAVQAIIRSYQARGHLAADVDPLGITTANLPQLGMRAPSSELIMRKYFNFVAHLDPLGISTGDPISSGDWHGGLRAFANEAVIRQHVRFDEADMDRVFKLPSTTFIGEKEKALPLREILNRLEQAYCNNIGIEFMFINSLEQCNWIRQRMEPPNFRKLPGEEVVFRETLRFGRVRDIDSGHEASHRRVHQTRRRVYHHGNAPQSHCTSCSHSLPVSKLRMTTFGWPCARTHLTWRRWTPWCKARHARNSSTEETMRARR
ncbi:unnamed protein product [Leptidea sinapis]|uniref:2-oxoglutarate dehydrogenase, mitochondrial n=1 Tax=Leptidea sinapis TaxID=189913 RepID=A0A5E4Q6H1_9NEOP|nr:unnamed protein product [Leptidea sinapis]